MKVSCVIVSYNNGKLLEQAILSVIKQTRPVDEILVADDGSSDGSRQLIEAFSHRFPSIRPILREQNLGVSANRDLAVREARCDFITCLDGDDYFLPRKIEAEELALRGHQGNIAYSDLKIVDRSKNRARTVSVANYSKLTISDRVRWLLVRDGQLPAAMLIPKRVHLMIGGYNHSLRTYEDWDYLLRLAAQPLRWLHSGEEGLAHHPGGGLSNQGALQHMRDRLRVLGLDQDIAREQVGLPSLVAIAGKVVASGMKWWAVQWYWERKRAVPKANRPYGRAT